MEALTVIGSYACTWCHGSCSLSFSLLRNTRKEGLYGLENLFHRNGFKDCLPTFFVCIPPSKEVGT